MSVAASKHVGPWTEADYLALGETPDKIELVDGSLLVSPRPSLRHQRIATKLITAFDAPAEAAGLLVLPEVNLRLGSGRIVEPDILVADSDLTGGIVEAVEAELVCEIVSPGNAGTDRLLKPQLYAAAGIAWYLRVEQSDPVELWLYRLHGERYELFAAAGRNETLRSDDPFAIALDTRTLP